MTRLLLLARSHVVAAAVVSGAMVLSGCSATGASTSARSVAKAAAGGAASPAASSGTPSSSASPGPSPALRLLPGMPAPLSPDDVWAADRPGQLSPAVAGFRDLIYVPNSGGNTVTEIDPHTYKIVRTFVTGTQPQHVVPSWDLKTLWVNNDVGNTLTAIDPRTGRKGRTVSVHDPYNLYFTPNGRYAVVMASLDRELVWRDPQTMAVKHRTPVPCYGVNHADFSTDGRYFIVSCEFSSQLLKVDTVTKRIVKVMASLDRELVWRDPQTMAIKHRTPVPCYGVNHADFSVDGRYFIVSCEFSSQLLKVDTVTKKIVKVTRLATRPGKGIPMPQDVKMAPDGKTFYVADMRSDGVWFVDGRTLTVTRFLPTGKGTHGLYVTRDSKRLLISNRGEGSISVLRFADNKLVAKWRIPGGGSPDMGGISSDGKVFWVSGRYNGVVYAISTVDGHLIKKIAVGAAPHGLCVYPQPGRYSLGHTGVFR